MGKKIIISLLCLLFVAGCSAPIETINSAEIAISGGNRYKALRLTPEIYNAADRDLADLLLKDSRGEVVPYFINTAQQKESSSRETYAMELIDSYLKDKNFYFDYKLAAEQKSDILATTIEFSTGDTNFAKSMEIYGSYDNLNWTFVCEDKLYSIDNKSKLQIEFKEPQKYTHYRFKLANNLEKISFTAVELVYSSKTSEEIYFIESLRPEFRIENKDRGTEIIIAGLKNLRLCDITIESDSMFKRTAATLSGVKKELYNLPLNDISYTDMTIPLDRHISREEIYSIIIDNADDKPINIKGIDLRYYADELVFEGTAGETYTLEFGSSSPAIAPVYDIMRYQDQVLKSAIDNVSLGKIHYGEAMPKERDYKVLFNIVVIVIALLLGAVIILRLKQAKA
ncbi:MAG: hypothetical protein LBB91_05680 [Clostridiales bacterium]|jgi:hypothetical protein|nr:hypothetical protein [Clostridiales bacterium]